MDPYLVQNLSLFHFREPGTFHERKDFAAHFIRFAHLVRADRFGLYGSTVPLFPVVGFTLPFDDQLSTRVLFGAVRACGFTYVPFLVTCGRTDVTFEYAGIMMVRISRRLRSFIAVAPSWRPASSAQF